MRLEQNTEGDRKTTRKVILRILYSHANVYKNGDLDGNHYY